MRRKMLVILMCAVSVMNMPFSVMAGEKIAQDDVVAVHTMSRYVNITQISGNIYTTSGKVNCGVDVFLRTSASVNVKMSIQKKSGSSWSTLKTWNKSYSNVKVATPTASYGSTAGVTYRMKYTVTVGTDKTTANTQSVIGKK